MIFVLGFRLNDNHLGLQFTFTFGLICIFEEGGILRVMPPKAARYPSEQKSKIYLNIKVC